MAEILTLQLATEATEEEVTKTPLSVLRNSGLATNAKALITDGWGKPYKVEIHGGKVCVSSELYNNYLEKRV